MLINCTRGRRTLSLLVFLQVVLHYNQRSSCAFVSRINLYQTCGMLARKFISYCFLVVAILISRASAQGPCEGNTDVGMYEDCILKIARNNNLCNSSALCITQGASSIIYFKHLRKSGTKCNCSNVGHLMTAVN